MGQPVFYKYSFPAAPLFEWRVYTLLNSLFLRMKGAVGLQVKKV